MTDLHAPARRIESAPPPHVDDLLPTRLPFPPAHPTILHRLELRLALWLLLRNARRHQAVHDYADQHRRHLNRALHARREHERLRAYALTGFRL